MQKHIFSMRKHKLTFSPVPASSMQKATLPPSGGGDKRGQDTKYGFLSPLDSPYLPFKPLSKAFAAKLEKRGLGSVRRAAYGTLLCPEFTLRYPPRMTVRGQTVQGVRPVAAKNSASINGVPLEHRTPLWAPRF